MRITRRKEVIVEFGTEDLEKLVPVIQNVVSDELIMEMIKNKLFSDEPEEEDEVPPTSTTSTSTSN